MSELNTKIAKATKWSSITEIIAKLITPITSIVLARLLTPEAFGVITTLSMVITFAEIFTDAGFQKYLIQHNFKDDIEKDQCTNVAFWSNFVLSMFIWLIIGLFSESLAAIVGNPGLGHVLTVSCISIPLAAFSSIQMALYKRDFDFKSLFKVRIIGICIPLFVTIPLAYILRSYWALVIGTITSNLVNAILLTVYSKWKPRIYFNIRQLKNMLSFTVWSMIEAISIWLTSYIDVFIIGIYLNEYYLGLYKTSMTVVGQITGLITAATTPILFSSLSRLQTDENAFKELFFKFQKIVAIFVFPIGVGIFCYNKLITNILLGSQWLETAPFIGLWGLTSTITIVLSHYSSEVYRAKGRPKISFLVQILHILFLWPTVYIAVQYGYETLYISRAIVRLQLVLANVLVMYTLIKMSPWKMIINIYPSCIAAIAMAASAYIFIKSDNSILWEFISAILSLAIYIAIILCFKTERRYIKQFIIKSRH